MYNEKKHKKRGKDMLNFLLSADATSTTGGWTTVALQVGMIGLVVVAFYFLLIRPQKKQEKAINEMRSGLAIGDEITTNGGIVGRILSMTDDTVLIGTSGDCTKIRILKSAIARVDKKSGEAEQKKE